jgi:hypothetical protein
MANLARVRCTWTGTAVVGPSVSTFYFTESGSGFVAALGTFFTSVRSLVPTGVAFRIESFGDLIDVATGELSGSWSDGSGTDVSANGAGSFSLGVGARVKWQTAGIRNGRRVTGSTYLVPLVDSAFDSTGTPTSAALTTIGNAAAALVSSATNELAIWSRPHDGLAGASNPVIASSAPDAVSWLRSRRT